METKYQALKILAQLGRDMKNAALVIDLDVLNYALDQAKNTEIPTDEFLAICRVVKFGIKEGKQNLLVETDFLLTLLRIDKTPLPWVAAKARQFGFEGRMPTPIDMQAWMRRYEELLKAAEEQKAIEARLVDIEGKTELAGQLKDFVGRLEEKNRAATPSIDRLDRLEEATKKYADLLKSKVKIATYRGKIIMLVNDKIVDTSNQSLPVMLQRLGEALGAEVEIAKQGEYGVQ